MRPPGHPALVLALSPLAALYGMGVGWRNARFDRGEGVTRAAIPVVSIGNLEAGGTGKSPMVLWMVEHLRTHGRVPAVVSRGYGGAAGAGPLDVSRGGGPLVAADRAGDEPVMLAAATRAIVVAGSDRTRGVARAVELGADVAILDDGFQHRRLARDLDIVLLDAEHPFGNGRLLPAGSLREPPAALARAGAVIMTRWTDDIGPDALGKVRAACGSVPIVRAAYRRGGFRDDAGSPVAAPRRVVAFCGIARPERFFEDLRAEGVEIAASFAFADHHRYSERDLARIAARARRAGAVPVTTAKDRARLGDAGRALSSLHLSIGLEILDPEPISTAVKRALERRS